MTRISEWATHGLKRTGWNLNTRAGQSGLALVCGLALLAAFYLTISSQTAVLGRQLQDAQASKTALIHDNADLRQQIAQKASIAELQIRTVEMGFIPARDVVFLPISDSLIMDTD